MKRLTLSIALVLVLFVVVATTALAAPVEQIADEEGLSRALQSTVRLIVPVEGEDGLSSTGSGTILTTDGYILTNFHVMGDTEDGTLYNSDGIAFVAVTPSHLGDVARRAYEAKLVLGDPVLDLAILHISASYDSMEVLPANLSLVPIVIGDSDMVAIGDEVSVIGYPSIGGESVTFTKGIISGFVDEDADGATDWLKTDTEINRGNSGGAAINDLGQLIGVPTWLVADVEIAGKIGRIRPINLASGLIANAQTTEGTIAPIVFAPAELDGDPLNPTDVFQEGVEQVYAFFDQEGLGAEDVLEGIWYYEDEALFYQSYKIEDLYGSSDIPASGSIWFRQDFLDEPPGVYRLDLYLNDELVQSGEFVVEPVGDTVLPVLPIEGPVLVSIQQQVPVTLTVVLPDDPTQTIEVPIVLDLVLQISIGSTIEMTVDVGEVEEPEVVVEEAEALIVPEDWLPYTAMDDSFSLYYPPDWEVDEEDTEEVTFSASSLEAVVVGLIGEELEFSGSDEENLVLLAEFLAGMGDEGDTVQILRQELWSTGTYPAYVIDLQLEQAADLTILFVKAIIVQHPSGLLGAVYVTPFKSNISDETETTLKTVLESLTTPTEVVVEEPVASPEGIVEDNRGLFAEVEAHETLTMLQWSSRQDSSGRFLLIGELRNDGDEAITYAKLIITLYDENGDILDIITGYATLNEIGPGKVSPFRITSSIPVGDVSSYRIQLED